MRLFGSEQARRAVDEADHLDHALDAIQVAPQFLLERGEQVKRCDLSAASLRPSSSRARRGVLVNASDVVDGIIARLLHLSGLVLVLT